MCIDPVDVMRKINHRTKAVVQVHVGGIEAPISQCGKIPVVSDAAQALGIFKGTYTCCSFQAIKHITTGDGGMIICPDAVTQCKAKLMRWFGIDRKKKITNNWQCYKKRQMTFDIEMMGYKRQMTNIAAMMGISGIRCYDNVILYRERLFKRYKELLSGLNGIKVVDAGEGARNTYWLLTVLVERRDDFAKMLFSHDIDNNLVHLRNDIYKIFGGKRADLPVMNALEKKYICLPLNMKVTLEDVEFICDKIRKGW
jgi:dTDP-4-amino-4,6-dideoxygalactose transaminase